MEIIIQGRQLNIGQSFYQYMEDELSNHLTRYFIHPVSCTVTISKENHHFHAHINIQTGKHHTLQGEGNGMPYEAFDHAFGRIKKRLKKYKEKISTQYHQLSSLKATPIKEGFIPDSTFQEKESFMFKKEHKSPLIIAEVQPEIKNLDIHQAVTELEKKDLSSFIFFDEHNNINFLYRKQNGHLGWFNPSIAQNQQEVLI